jgi:acyl dehydratase
MVPAMVHGVLLLGLMSNRMFAEERVGPNVCYGYERVRFVRPVIAGSTILIRGRVSEVRPERAQAVIEETCHNPQGELQVVAHHLFRFL